MRRGGYRKSETSQQQILEAAVRTIAAKGLADSSVQDIAAAAGVSKGVVHYHFESKDELLAKVVNLACTVMAERVRAAFLEPGTAAERMRRAITELWFVRRSGVPEIRVIMEAMTVAVHDPALHATIGAALRTSREQVVQVGFTNLEEMGLAPRFAPDTMARLLLGALDGLALHQLFDPMPPESEAELLAAAERIAMSLFSER